MWGHHGHEVTNKEAFLKEFCSCWQTYICSFIPEEMFEFLLSSKISLAKFPSQKTQNPKLETSNTLRGVVPRPEGRGGGDDFWGVPVSYLLLQLRECVGGEIRESNKFQPASKYNPRASLIMVIAPEFPSHKQLGFHAS